MVNAAALNAAAQEGFTYSTHLEIEAGVASAQEFLQTFKRAGIEVVGNRNKYVNKETDSLSYCIPQRCALTKHVFAACNCVVGNW